MLTEASTRPFCQGSPAVVRAAARRIEEDLEQIIAAIHGTSHRVDAVVLSGSLGRGEGMLLGSWEAPTLLSDYDMYVFTAEALDPAAFRDLEPDLSRKLWGPKVTIGALATRQLPTLPAALWTFDLRYGSRVVDGDARLLETVPAYRTEDIPPWEGLKLLCNYSAVLLDALQPVQALGPADSAEGRILREALVRLACRVADALVIRDGCYHPLLSRRPETLANLAAFKALAPHERDLITWACGEKVVPRDFSTFDPVEMARSLFPLLERVLGDFLRRFLRSGRETLPDLLADYRRRFRLPLSWKGHVHARLQRLASGDPDGLPWAAVALNRYHYVLSIPPLVLLSTPDLLARPGYLREACRLLGLPRTPSAGPTRGTWRGARDTVLRLWKAVCL